MNNPIVVFNPCGIEVSQLTLVVAWREGVSVVVGGERRLRSFYATSC